MSNLDDANSIILRYVNLTTQERSYKASFFEFVHAFEVYGTDPVTPHYVST